MLGVIRHQPGIGAHRRELLETMSSGSSRPVEFFTRVCFDEWHEPRRIVEHCWPNIDDLIDAVRPREHPAFTMRAKEMTVLPVHPADDRLAANHETIARKHGGQ